MEKVITIIAEIAVAALADAVGDMNVNANSVSCHHQA